MTFIGINVPWDKEADALRFVDEVKHPYPLVRDANGSVLRTYGVEATPVTYVIDRGGRVAAATVGALEPAELTRLIESTLAKT